MRPAQSAALVFALGAAPAHAAETLASALARIDGAEVSITGHIGTGLNLGDGEALSFRDSSGGMFHVIMDAGRDARKSIDGCKFEMFGGGTPCAIDAIAVIERDGSKLQLAITTITTIEKPAKLP